MTFFLNDFARQPSSPPEHVTVGCQLAHLPALGQMAASGDLYQAGAKVHGSAGCDFVSK